MQNLDRTLRVAIAQGDTNGIGYELILKTLADPEILELFTPVVYGSPSAVYAYAEVLGINFNCVTVSSAREIREGKVNVVNICASDSLLEIGVENDASKEAARESILAASYDCIAGLVDVVVMAPSSKSEVEAIVAGLCASAEDAGEQFDNSSICPLHLLHGRFGYTVSLAGNASADQAKQAISVEAIVACGHQMHKALYRDLNMNVPRIAIVGLDGVPVKEAVAKLANESIQAFGPYDAAEFYENEEYKEFDGIITMNNAQFGQTYVNEYGDSGIRVIIGLPIVATSVIAGPSYAIAGNGIADESSFRDAVFTAMSIYRNRFYYDQPLKNPLQKMYHERREDGEKVRFAVKKKDPASASAPAGKEAKEETKEATEEK